MGTMVSMGVMGIMDIMAVGGSWPAGYVALLSSDLRVEVGAGVVARYELHVLMLLMTFGTQGLATVGDR